MEKRKRRWGDRKDGYWLRDQDGLHKIMPYIMLRRTEAEAFFKKTLDLSAVEPYLERKNAGDPQARFTLFHVIGAAAVKAVTLRPKMNRFVQGRRVYQREQVSLGFVAKRRFADDGGEALIYLHLDEDVDIDAINKKLRHDVEENRSGKQDHTTDVMDWFGRLPRWLLRIAMWILRSLDHFGKVPYALIKDDVNFASIFMANLGSIGGEAIYHHLNNWGTNSLFVTIGKKYMAEFTDEDGKRELRPAVDIGITIDERIADGYYYIKTVNLIDYLVKHPELLDRPANEEVNI